MRHPETSLSSDRVRVGRKFVSGAIAIVATLLLGMPPSLAQDAVTPGLRPAAPIAPEQPATSPRVLNAEPASPAPAAAPVEAPSPQATAPQTAAPAEPTAAPTAPASSAPTSGAPVGDAPATTPVAAAPAGEAPTPSEPAAVLPQGGADIGQPTTGQSVGLPGAPAPAPAPAPAQTPETAGTASLPHDLSPWGMFMAADIIVKSVMVGLAFASVVTWTIWLAKALELFAARTKAARALRCLERASTLAEAVEAGRKWPKRGPVAALAQAALLETSRSGGLDAEGVKERAAVALHRIEARAGRAMSRGTGLLATIGSTAPFVGLFGTVWGIMNSFIGISQANTTNLAVVAPGIAEALLATAIGLVAAIPAVIIYNVFARSIAGYRAVLADASAEVLRHLSRDLDRAGGRRTTVDAAGHGVLQAAE